MDVQGRRGHTEDPPVSVFFAPCSVHSPLLRIISADLEKDLCNTDGPPTTPNTFSLALISKLRSPGLKLQPSHGFVARH